MLHRLCFSPSGNLPSHYLHCYTLHVLMVDVLSTRNSYGSRRQYTSPSINKVNNAIPINGDVLPCYHLYCFLCHNPSQERSNVWKVSSWCANAMCLVSQHLSSRERAEFTFRRQRLRSLFRQAPYWGSRMQYARVARSPWAHRFG